MWKANIARTERNGKTLNIIISYTNGVNSFDETIYTDRPQSDTWLSEQIKTRLNELNSLDVFEASIQADPVIVAKDVTVEDVQVLIDEKAKPVEITPIDPVTPLEDVIIEK
jgi:hypothetical protein